LMASSSQPETVHHFNSKEWIWRVFKADETGGGLQHVCDLYTGMKYRTFCGKWIRRERCNSWETTRGGSKCEMCEELLKSRKVAEIIGGGK